MDRYYISRQYEKLKLMAVRHTSIQITDNKKIIVDDCRGVEMFDENTIVLGMSFGSVRINGLDLKMRNFSDHGVVITGQLHSIGFDAQSRQDT